MIINIARKELKSVFSSPMGWIILSLLMFGFGFMYLDGVNNYFQIMSGSIRPAERVGVTIFVGQTVYGAANFLMTVATPLLTMRLISEERRNQTLPFLFSAPITLTEIVLGKFLGLVLFLAILIIYIFVMLSTLNIWADIDFGYLLGNSFGLMLLVASFSSLGIYFSSLTNQPIIAAILTFIALFAMGVLSNYFASDPSHWFNYVSLTKHYQAFTRGVIDSSDVVYFILFIATFLTLTIRRLDSDRLSG
ncbi:MAG: ABC transporter permease subunit [Methylophilales bacterium]|jgi:ABC-2 type transport system permease protein|nr:ABC transporter permease subunit [Pseudomonadota bacterium]NQW35359.1 ABC transporter permease subunit [Methylophilales bacterium]|tara:strand:- start:11269 stop:12015 length:747 start_codon:yes stop_codon:yes gene_type:complete